MNNDEMLMETGHAWSKALCECAGYDEDYAKNFWERLINSQGVLSEFLYYMVYQNFACQYLIEGISIVDIMVWQLDHFKASMDMDREQKKNPDLMLLTAFVTMLDMELEPDKFIAKIRTDTGTDYPGKF